MMTMTMVVAAFGTSNAMSRCDVHTTIGVRRGKALWIDTLETDVSLFALLRTVRITNQPVVFSRGLIVTIAH